MSIDIYWAFIMSRFCPDKVLFTPHFLSIVVEVKDSGPPHGFGLWFWYLAVYYYRVNVTAIMIKCTQLPSYVGGILPDLKHSCFSIIDKVYQFFRF